VVLAFAGNHLHSAKKWEHQNLVQNMIPVIFGQRTIVFVLTGCRVVIAVLLAIFAFFAIQLENHQEWGMPFILSIQDKRTFGLDALMRTFSFVGFELFWVLIPSFVWKGNPKYQR
jgi:hypothetical protein